MELTIVAQGLADFRLSSQIVEFGRLSLKSSLSASTLGIVSRMHPRSRRIPTRNQSLLGCDPSPGLISGGYARQLPAKSPNTDTKTVCDQAEQPVKEKRP
jgi:hypothetical protein